MHNPAIALLGCGRWGRLILRDLKQLGCHVTVFAQGPNTRQNAEQGQADQIVDDLSALSAHSLDGIVIATPTVTHAAMLEAMIPLGLPIYCEKPLTADAASAQRIAETTDSQVFCMEKWRYHPAIERIKEIHDSGQLGAITGIRSLRTQWQQPHTDVGATWILLPHDFSMALHLLGELPELIWAHALPGPDSDRGLIVQLGARPACVFEISACRPGYIRRFDVQFEGGSLGFNGDDHRKLLLCRPDGSTGTLELPDCMPLLEELRAFVGFLQGGPAPLSSAADAAQVVLRVEQSVTQAGLPPLS